MNLRGADRKPSNLVLDCVVLGREARAILCDVSPTGCRIEMFDAPPPPRGATIVFEVADPLFFAGEVVWVRGNESGVKFTKQLSLAALRALEI